MDLLPSLEDFSILKAISKGGFGRIDLARRKVDQQLFAIKSISKARIHKKNISQQVFNERDALALVNCEFVVRIYYSFQTESDVHLVMEYMVGGDLKSLLSRLGRFSNFMTRFYVVEVAVALYYLHQKKIIHKDIKPDNILISNSGHIKLTDFGLSQLNLDHKLCIDDLMSATPLRSQLPFPGKAAMATPLNSNYTARIRKIQPRTPRQLLSLTTQFTFSPARQLSTSESESVDLMTPPNRFPTLPVRTPVEHNNLTISSALPPLKGLPLPFIENFSENLSIEEKDKNAMSPNTRLLDVVSQARKSLSDICLKPMVVHSSNPSNSHHVIPEVSSANSEPVVWGTPDYLAPEALLYPVAECGPEVDWWALGVCFYEFLCGFAPFNDINVELIFSNIIGHNIAWPPLSNEEPLDCDEIALMRERLANPYTFESATNDETPTMSKDAYDIVSQLLQPDPLKRANYKSLKTHPYFSLIDWDSISSTTAPFVPNT